MSEFIIAYDITGSMVKCYNDGNKSWTKSTSAKGTVGTDLVVPLLSRDNIAFEVVVNAPQANSDATLNIYKDGNNAGSVLFSGYLVDRNNDGAVVFPRGKACVGSIVVDVDGGSGDLFAAVKYV